MGDSPNEPLFQTLLCLYKLGDDEAIVDSDCDRQFQVKDKDDFMVAQFLS